MTKLNEAYQNTLLADATYVSGLNSTSDIVTKLSLRMTPTLAEEISRKFTLVTQIESSTTSFDATVWRANHSDGTPDANGKVYVSMRGSQQPTDFLVDGDLAITGNGRLQVAEMINWWLRISTPVGYLCRARHEFGGRRAPVPCAHPAGA